MNKPNRAISTDEALVILKTGKYGVLSTASTHCEPYGVPVNYCYSEQEHCIFFHCAKAGKKLDNIAENDRVSFVVIGYEAVVPERFITHYESVVVTGKAQIVHDDKEKTEKLLRLCGKFAPDVPNRRDEVIQKYLPAMVICKISIDAMTGKRNDDL